MNTGKKYLAFALCGVLVGVAGTMGISWYIQRGERSALNQEMSEPAFLPVVAIRGAAVPRNITTTGDRSQPDGNRSDPARRPAGRIQAGTVRNPSVVALFIGNDLAPPNTGLGPLEGAVADMELLREALVEGLGVPDANIELLRNEQGTRAAIWRALDALSRNTISEDLVVVAYAGHGGSRGEGGEAENFLMTPGGITPIPALLERLAELPAKNRLLLIDACRSGQRPGERFQLSAADLNQARSLAWIASCGNHEQSYEIAGHGLFSYELAKALRNAHQLDTDRDGFLSFTELAEHVKRSVAARAAAYGQQQTPWYGVIAWPGDQRLFAARPPWTIALQGKPVMRTTVGGRYAPELLGPTETLWVVVVPTQAGGRWWPMGQPANLLKQNRWESPVHLGNRTSPLGEAFRILLVRADNPLTAHFREYLRGPGNAENEGMYIPDIRSLPIVAETTVRRIH